MSPVSTDSRTPATLVPHVEPDTTIKVIGLGGVGSIVARYLCVFLASLKTPARLVLIDGDEFEEANAARMLFSRCGNKAAVVRDDLAQRAEGTELALSAIQEFVTPASIGRLIHDGDIVLLAVDNHATRKLVSEYCTSTLADVCLISGGNDGVGPDSAGVAQRGTFGNVQVYVRRGGRDASPPLTHYHTEIREPADHLPGDVSCTELLASTPQILFTNLATASAMLNAFWLHTASALHYSELCFDIAEGLMRPCEWPAPAYKTEEACEG